MPCSRFWFDFFPPASPVVAVSRKLLPCNNLLAPHAIPAKCLKISPLFPGMIAYCMGGSGGTPWRGVYNVTPYRKAIRYPPNASKSSQISCRCFYLRLPPDNWFQHLQLDAACPKRFSTLITHFGSISSALLVATPALLDFGRVTSPTCY